MLSDFKKGFQYRMTGSPKHWAWDQISQFKGGKKDPGQ